MHRLVMAAAAGDEHEGHEATTDAQREDNTEDQRDPAMDADRDRIEAIEKPRRAGERQQQKKNKETDQQSGFQS